MAKPSINLLTTGDVGPITAPTPETKPNKVLFLKIRFEGAGTVIKLEYAEMADYQIPAADDIEKTLTKYCGDMLNLTWRSPQRHADPLRRRGKMSLELKQRRYIVFSLPDGNVRFSRGEYPIQVHTDVREVYYWDAWCAWYDGTNIRKFQKGPPNVDCRIAYFVANSDLDASVHSDDFVSAFNLYLDVVDENDDDDFIPIAIDPDVGYPGGHS